MKILHVINNLNRGGAETLLLKIIPMMKQNTNWDISVVIIEDVTYLLPLFEAAGIKVHILPILHKKLFIQIYELTVFMRKMKPDLVHTHLIYGDTRGQLSAFLAGVKSRVLTLHNMELPTTKGSEILTKLSSFLAKKIITVSESIQEYHVVPNIYDVKKMETIYNFPSFKAESTMVKGQIGNPIKLVQVARLKPQKAQNVLIDAVAELNQIGINCVLNIYGTGELQEELEEQIERLALKNVFLNGLTERVEEKLLDSDLFISSSLWEGFNMGLVEALSVGLPVIATDLPPHREILTKNRDYSFLVSPGSSVEIVEAVKKVVSMNYSGLCKTSCELAKEFSIEKFMEDHVALYSTLLNDEA